MPSVPTMNKKEIKERYKTCKKELKLDYKTGKKRRKYAYRMRKTEQKFAKKNAEGAARKAAKLSLRAEKKDYKKEAYLQKSIYLEKKAALQKKRREELGSVVQIVAERVPESLVGSLTLSYVLIVLVFALLQGILVVITANQMLVNRSSDTLETVAATLEAGDLQESIARRLAEDPALHIAVYDEEENLLYACGDPALTAVLPYNQRWDRAFSFRHRAETMRVYSTRVEREDGVCLLNVAKDMESENAMLSMIVNLLLVAVAVMLCLCYFVGYRVAKKQLRPIGVLGRAMEEMSAARLSDRLETENIRTELVEVVDSYNHMLDKIEDAYERQKRFVSDASHELRTPLAVINGYADILSRWGGEDPAMREEAVEAILSQSANMQQLLERLLYIARSESGKIEVHPEQVELAPLCGEMLQDFRMMYPARNFALEGEGSAYCDPNLVRQLLTILLDNAVKFTAEEGHITLKIIPGQKNTALCVIDDGVGMSAETADHIFERFYKGDASHNEKGYGLGLSIAKLIAESQGGSVSVESEEGKGSTFAVALPL
ncbi:MAG: hypothetical protein IJP27_03525 [Clostridia bacterium]|nr:hypothetical protein [Clostridia bacterium]